MYQQITKPRELTLLSKLLVLLCTLGVILLFYVLYGFLSALFSAGFFSLLFLIALLMGGYAVLRGRESEYHYTLTVDTLVLEQYAFGRMVKSFTVPRKAVLSLTDDGDGRRMFPRGSKPVSLRWKQDGEERCLRFAPDDTLREYLFLPGTDLSVLLHREALFAFADKLISFPSVREAALPDAPYGKPCRDVLHCALSRCAELGMRTKNLDNKCGWAEIGSGDPLLGILCHLDVVPAGEGWLTDPFSAVHKDGKLYGRGAIDDKGPAAAAIYALNAVHEAGIPVSGRVRLIFGCDEECDCGCMERYSLTEELPAMAFTPDASFPVIAAEKGIVHCRLSSSLQEGPFQLYLESGLYANIVPANATATVIGDIGSLSLVPEEGITFSTEGNVLTVSASGVAAHGSTPQKGTSALLALVSWLNRLDLGGDQGQFLKDYCRLLSASDGSGLGLACRDEESGELTVNPGICRIGRNSLFPEMTDASVTVVVDIRYPVTVPLSRVTGTLAQAIPPHWDLDVPHTQGPLCVDTASPLVTALMKVYRDYTGRLQDEPIAVGGGTYARTMKNAVAFGAQFAGEEDTAHMANEYIFEESLLKNARIYAAAIVALIGGNTDA